MTACITAMSKYRPYCDLVVQAYMATAEEQMDCLVHHVFLWMSRKVSSGASVFQCFFCVFQSIFKDILMYCIFGPSHGCLSEALCVCALLHVQLLVWDIHCHFRLNQRLSRNCEKARWWFHTAKAQGKVRAHFTTGVIFYLHLNSSCDSGQHVSDS